MSKPIFLIDLDDTVFQTKRKMDAEGAGRPFRTGALDRSLQPRSFLTKKQANLIDWLNQSSATVIPVTARGTEEMSLVQIEMNSYKICSHGAVILDKNNEPVKAWQEHIQSRVDAFKRAIYERKDALESKFKSEGIEAWARINHEYNNTPIYLVSKHTDSTKIRELYDAAKDVDSELGLDGFYRHSNGNNIAWIPEFIDKGNATEFLLEMLETEENDTPVLGFGDSISDFRFMKHCQFMGMPTKGQIFDLVADNITLDT